MNLRKTSQGAGTPRSLRSVVTEFFGHRAEGKAGGGGLWGWGPCPQHCSDSGHSDLSLRAELPHQEDGMVIPLLRTIMQMKKK